MLRLRTFGGLALDPSTPLERVAVRRRPLVLLALLAAAGERGMSRDKITGYLWP
jgi:DNA-binding SARP family transcriptional activator